MELLEKYKDYEAYILDEKRTTEKLSILGFIFSVDKNGLIVHWCGSFFKKIKIIEQKMKSRYLPQKSQKWDEAWLFLEIKD